MKNDDKHQLARFVVTAIRNGKSKTQTVNELSKLGFKRRTVAVYYKVFSTDTPAGPAATASK